MIFEIHQPAKSPSSGDCRDALTKGLGRARLWADGGLLAVDDLCWACVNDLRYDRQCEDSRADWLWMLIERSDFNGACEDRVWEAMGNLSENRSADQVVQLSMRYSLLGRERFKRRLFEIVSDKPFDGDLSLGEYELMVVAGLDGFRVAARKRGERPSNAEWQLGDDWFVTDAIELFGEATIQDTLAADQDDNVKRFELQWRTQNSVVEATTHRESQRDRMRAIPVKNVFAAAKTQDRCFWFRAWGIHAEASDVELVFDRLLKCDDPDELCRLLKVFIKRELPRVEQLLFEFFQSSHKDVATFAIHALGGNVHPAVRAFALKCLQTGEVMNAVELLTSNYESGDERLITEAIAIPEGADSLHELMMACKLFLEANPSADADPLAFLIYAHTPCSLCRTSAVKVLKQQQKVPVWMMDEVRFDCDESTRQLFYPQPSFVNALVTSRLSELRVAAT